MAAMASPSRQQSRVGGSGEGCSKVVQGMEARIDETLQLEHVVSSRASAAIFVTLRLVPLFVRGS